MLGISRGPLTPLTSLCFHRCFITSTWPKKEIPKQHETKSTTNKSSKTDKMEFTTTPEERKAAAALREGKSTATSSVEKDASSQQNTKNTKDTIFYSIAGSEIDPDCRQKYVLIQLNYFNESRMLVRGSQYAAYHKDAAEKCIWELRRANIEGLSYEVLGGGRIVHDGGAKRIEVYGKSYGFPWFGEPRHEVSKEVLEVDYPDFVITTSNDGY